MRHPDIVHRALLGTLHVSVCNQHGLSVGRAFSAWQTAWLTPVWTTLQPAHGFRASQHRLAMCKQPTCMKWISIPGRRRRLLRFVLSVPWRLHLPRTRHHRAASAGEVSGSIVSNMSIARLQIPDRSLSTSHQILLHLYMSLGATAPCAGKMSCLTISLRLL